MRVPGGIGSMRGQERVHSEGLKGMGGAGAGVGQLVRCGEVARARPKGLSIHFIDLDIP